jgi:deazaflavin-dependent oxidoreductase (nitroreductase family)
VPLTGEYAPPPKADWVREQLETWERSGGTEGTTLRDTGMHRTPLMRVEHDGAYLAVGSKGGAPKDPVWVANLRANPQVEVWDGPAKRDYVVRELEPGDERDTWWERGVAAYPPYTEYQQNCERLIPLFVLEPVA